MKNTAYKKRTLVSCDETISKFVDLLLNLWICKNIKTIENRRNPHTTITRHDAPTYINNTLFVLILRDINQILPSENGERM